MNTIVEKILRKYHYHLPENWQELTIMKLKVHMIQFVRESTDKISYYEFTQGLTKVSNANLTKIVKRIQQANEYNNQNQN